MAKSNAEESFWLQLQAAVAASELPCLPEREYRFHDTRKWRLDFAWPDRRIVHPVVFYDIPLAVEIEGGQWLGRWGKKSRHTTGEGFQGDIEKYNAAAAWGWTVYRVTPAMVASGEALRIVKYEFGLIERSEVDGTRKI